MKLQVTNHDYMNTGGGCMVSIFTIYDEQLNRTLYLMINEEGGSLSTADYISTEVEFADNMLIDSFSISTLKPTDNNFELFRDCFIEHVKKDCQRYKHTYALRFEQLPKELQQQLTPEYRKWHEEHIGSYYETDGYKMILDAGFRSKQERAAEMITALTNFRDAYKKLLDIWNLYDLNSTEAIQKYPFEKSFDELTIVEWCNETINEISK